MSRDFDDLAAAWTHDGQPGAQVERNRQLWQRAAWRSRVANVLETATLLAIAAVLVGHEIYAPSLGGVVMTAVTLLVLAWVQWRRYRARHDELVNSDAERVGFLQDRIASLRARMLRNGLALALIVPSFLFGVILARMRTPTGAVPQRDLSTFIYWFQSPAGRALLIALLLVIIGRLVQVWLRDRRAVKTLKIRLFEYQQESLRDA